jgi:outer membrane protein assembly factor BamE (lipoprotein component of BamABCDE complex)
LGQTKDQVVAAMGQPVRIADLGKKQIYYYKDLKITFVDGKVTDVQ